MKVKDAKEITGSLTRTSKMPGLSYSLPAWECKTGSKLRKAGYSLSELKEALFHFDKSGGRRISFEYTMIRGVNDSLDLAPKLAKLAYSLNAFVNLIPFNPIPYQNWKSSTGKRIEGFRSILEEKGVAVAVRVPRGRDIDAACGQLRAKALVDPSEK